MGLDELREGVGRGVVDGGGAEEGGGADPDVEPAEGGEGLVDEEERGVFGGDVEGVGDELGVGVGCGERAAQGGEEIGVGGFVACCVGRDVRGEWREEEGNRGRLP